MMTIMKRAFAMEKWIHLLGASKRIFFTLKSLQRCQERHAKFGTLQLDIQVTLRMYLPNS